MRNATHSSTPSNPSDYACIDLVNSWFTDYLGGGKPTDRIWAREWQQWFFERYWLYRGDDEVAVEDLVALRRDFRRILRKWSRGAGVSVRDVRLLDRRVRKAALRQRVTITTSGIAMQLEPFQRDWSSVVATITASAVELLSEGDPKRLKTCMNPACSWMFYDNTINRSKQFCATSPCASLVRVRRFRQRD